MGRGLSKCKALGPVIRPVVNEVKVKSLILTRPLVARRKERQWTPWVNTSPHSPAQAGLSP